MFTMTVHGDRSRFPAEKGPLGRGLGLVNGERKLEGPLLENLTLSQSWNGCIWQLQRTPQLASPTTGQVPASPISPPPSAYRDIPPYIRRDSGKSRESPVSLGSYTSSERNRLAKSYDDDSLTTASSNLDSTDQEEEYVTLDRSYVFPRSFSTPTHHSSMIDLKHNSLYSPKISNVELAARNFRTSPGKQSKFRTPLRSVSVNETELDAVGLNGKPMPWTKRSLNRIYENIGDVLKSKSSKNSGNETKTIKSEYVGTGTDINDNDVTACNDITSTSSCSGTPGRERKRSKSLGELRLFNKDNENELDSDDEDGDAFGFLSYPFVHSSAAMHKAKSPLQPRILPKRWRSKPRNSTSGTCLWSPEGNCTWCNVSGRKIVLRPVSLLQLSEAERLALQKISLSKLQSMGLGCTVTIPKERQSGRRKKHLLSIKRSKSANLSGLIHGFGDKEKDRGVHPSGMVFGVPLYKCIANDMELQRKRNSGSLRERKDSDVVIHRQPPRKSSSSSQSSADNLPETTNGYNENQKRTASSDSLDMSESEGSRNSSSLLDALSLSSARKESLIQNYLPLYATGAPQVPHIVNVCFKHIETYGLRVLGIFRVGSSKKRTKQLRDEFDTGRDVKLNESHNPHEVGALLKEYFRDLPEPLLTRDLYSAYVATQDLEERARQLAAIQMLISLLPVPNRDTLWALLQFLATVDRHSTDAIDEHGLTLLGSKMDTHNLATLFGPNILHKAKATEKAFTVERMERAEERREVIDVVKVLIDNHRDLYQIPASLYDEVLQVLLQTDPEATDMIMKRLSNDPMVDADPDTTTSSILDDSDASLPHSPASDTHFQYQNTSTSQAHPRLRVAKSAEALTPCSRRRFFFSSLNDAECSDKHKRKSEAGNVDGRPRFQLVIDGTPPSPPEPQRTPVNSRSQRVKVSRDSSTPERGMRPHSMHVERPHSEMFATPRKLAIPDPDYMQQYSNSSSNSQSNTSLHSPVRSDSFYDIPRSASNSPRITSSKQRPLDVRRTPDEGSNEWQRDRWRQWDSVATDQPDGYEQETLV